MNNPINPTELTNTQETIVAYYQASMLWQDLTELREKQPELAPYLQRIDSSLFALQATLANTPALAREQQFITTVNRWDDLAHLRWDNLTPEKQAKWLFYINAGLDLMSDSEEPAPAPAQEQ